MQPQSLKQLTARYGRIAAGLAGVLVIAALAGLYSSLHKPQSAETLDGKWVGKVTWNDASKRPYQQTMRTALFFLPKNVIGIVITFPTGAIGGAGKYTLHDSRLSVRGENLSVNGRPMPLSTFSGASWYHAATDYIVSYRAGSLVLTPYTPGPTPAPCWPLLVSPNPIVLSRIAPPDEPAPTAAPRE